MVDKILRDFARQYADIGFTKTFPSDDRQLAQWVNKEFCHFLSESDVKTNCPYSQILREKTDFLIFASFWTKKFHLWCYSWTVCHVCSTTYRICTLWWIPIVSAEELKVKPFFQINFTYQFVQALPFVGGKSCWHNHELHWFGSMYRRCWYRRFQIAIYTLQGCWCIYRRIPCIREIGHFVYGESSKQRKVWGTFVSEK